MDIELSDRQLATLFRRTRSFVCVGVSANPVRPSHFVARYLHLRGFRVYPVNPAYAGEPAFGSNFLPSLASIPPDECPDVLDIFRKPSEVPGIVEQALEMLPGLKVVWMQVGIRNAEAANAARERGLTVIQNRCPKIEHQRLYGELRKMGFNTRIISSRIPSRRLDRTFRKTDVQSKAPGISVCETS